MNLADQIISNACSENPIKGLLLSTFLDGGRFVTTGDKISELLGLIPESLIFERRELNLPAGFSDFSAKDLILVESTQVDQIWNLSRYTSAQIALMGDSSMDPALIDLVFREGDLRSALIQIQKDVEVLKGLKGQVHLDGSPLNKALFLDRDGVLIKDTGYVDDPAKVKILNHVVEGLRAAREKGYLLIVVTNQSGIGRGMIHWSQYEKVSHKMLQLLADEGVFIDKIIRAPYYEKSQFASGLVRRGLRKPRSGMILSALGELRVDVTQSILIGDSATDLKAGAMAGISKLYLMESEKAESELAQWKQWPLLSRALRDSQLGRIRQISEALNA